MKRLVLLAWALAIATRALAAEAGDPVRGRIVAEVRCGPCHFLFRDAPKIGPGLKGVFGRKPRIAGVPFARWDEAALFAWLSGPRRIKPNTKMQIPPLAVRDIRDVIAFLRTNR